MSRRAIGPDASRPSTPVPVLKAPGTEPRRSLAYTGGHDERQRQLGALLEYSPDAIVIVDRDAVVSEWNPAAEALFGVRRAEAVGAQIQSLLYPPHGEHFNAAWQQLLDGGTALRYEDRWDQGSGANQKLDVIFAPIRSDGGLVGGVMIFRNVKTFRSKTASQVPTKGGISGSDGRPALTKAGRDGPGGLPGRHWVQRVLSEPPTAGLGRGVAVFDIDVFTMVNATYGPDVADDVLSMFATLLRSLDTAGTFAHWRADVFVWIVDAEDPVRLLNALVAAVTATLAEPLGVGGHKVWLSLNFGLATDTLAAGGDLLAAARDALQSAREKNDSGVVYYDASMESSAASTFKLATDLHQAIDHDELLLHYQPILELSTNEIVGVEALVRWNRPGVGLLAPGLFIDAAERTGQIVSLGNWVIRTACSKASLLGDYSGGPRTMSINVSTLQLHDPSLITTLRDAMVEGNCLPSTIVVEVTESVLLHDLQVVAASLEAIKALDVGLDLDDFGTGFSSLHYLKNLPIDRLKVDQGFVAGLGTNTADTAIVASTIGLAHALGLKAIAEGVETTEQLALLRELGCDFAQGYLLSRPVDIDTLATWIESYEPDALSHTPAALLQERSKGADRRDTEASARDTTADDREATADDREQVADLRDIAATQREDAEDGRERANGGSARNHVRGDTTSTRRTAKQDRRRASAGRVVEADDRARASKARDAASATREGRMGAHSPDPDAASPAVDGAS